MQVCDLRKIVNSVILYFLEQLARSQASKQTDLTFCCKSGVVIYEWIPVASGVLIGSMFPKGQSTVACYQTHSDHFGVINGCL